MWRGRPEPETNRRPSVVTARVIPGFGSARAVHEARALGGRESDGDMWSFPVTPAFKRDGGVMRLRRAGLMPLELWRDGTLLAVWVDYEDELPVMRWRGSGPAIPEEAT